MWSVSQPPPPSTESKRSRAADTGKKDATIDLISTHGGSGRAGGYAGLIGASKTKAKAHGAEKRKHPTLGEKAEILDLLIKKKMRQTAVAEKTGFALKTIQRVVTDREKLEAKLKEQPSAANNKTFRGPKYPEVDTIVMEMIDQYISVELPINRATIQTFGRKACAAAVDRARSDEQRRHHLNFSASEHWAKNFIARRGLRSVGLHEEAGSVDDATIAEGMAEIRVACNKYEPENIYNEDETGLCYRLLPKRTYLASAWGEPENEAGCKGYGREGAALCLRMHQRHRNKKYSPDHHRHGENPQMLPEPIAPRQVPKPETGVV